MTTETAYLPSPKEVRDLLSGLFGKDVRVSPCEPFAPGLRRAGTIGVFVEDSMRIAALVTMDLSLSAYAGAALALIPRRVALESVKDGYVPENLAENLYEVLNVSAMLFNVDGAPHVRLYMVHPAGSEIPQHLLAHALTLGRREDLSVHIAGYGSGRIGLVLVP